MVMRLTKPPLLAKKDVNEGRKKLAKEQPHRRVEQQGGSFRDPKMLDKIGRN